MRMFGVGDLVETVNGGVYAIATRYSQNANQRVYLGDVRGRTKEGRDR